MRLDDQRESGNIENRRDEGDFPEGVLAAQAIGDDTLQRQMQGRVVPDSFTHGSADQRIRWLWKGFESGDPDIGGSFSMPEVRP
jgi:predicted metalloprotease